MATKGRTDAGANARSIKNRIIGRLETFAAGDEITDITVYTNCTTAAKNLNVALYNAADGSRLALGTETSDATGTAWISVPISYTVSSVTDIVISVCSAGGTDLHEAFESNNAAVTAYYDSGAGIGYPPAATWSAGGGWGTDVDYDVSMYATYTPAAGGDPEGSLIQGKLLRGGLLLGGVLTR